MTQCLENFNLQIAHDHISRRSLKIQSHSLKFYFRTGQSSWYNFPFVSSVSSKLKQIYIKKIVNKKRKNRKKNYPQRYYCKQNRLKALNLCSSISTWFCSLEPGLWLVTLLKKRRRHRCFPVNFAKFLRTPFFLEHLRWLFLWNSTEYEWTQKHPHRFLLLVPEFPFKVTLSSYRSD